VASDLATMLFEVRRLIGDRRKGDPICTDPYLEELVTIAVDEMSDEIGTGTIKTTAFVTMVAGTATYTVTLPSSVPSLLHLQEMVNPASGYPLDKKPLGWILAQRINNENAVGEPRYFCVREDDAQVLTLELYPAPNVTGPLSAFWEPVHRTVQAGGSYTTLAFSKRSLTALRMRIAGLALGGLDAESLKRLSPPKDRKYGERLIEQSFALASAEFSRLHQGEMVDYVERNR